MSLFLAYRNRDIRIVRRLVKALESYDGIPPLWFAERELSGRTSIAPIVEQQIQACDTFLYCLGSPEPRRVPPSLDPDITPPDDSADEGSIYLAKETEKALERLREDDDFRIYCIRLRPRVRLPRQLRPVVDRVHVDLSGLKWRYNLPRLVKLVRK